MNCNNQGNHTIQKNDIFTQKEINKKTETLHIGLSMTLTCSATGPVCLLVSMYLFATAKVKSANKNKFTLITKKN